MAFDITEFLMEILCQQNTIGQCQQFVSEYNEPVMQTIYFFFFPTVFVILFIHMLSKQVAENIDAKFRIMIAMAIFVFIVVQGWYHFLLILSRMWFISIIVLGGLWAFLNMGLKRGMGGGGSSGGQKSVFGRAAGSVGGYLSNRTLSAVRGDEKRLNGAIMQKRAEVERIERAMRHAHGKPDGDRAAADLMRQKTLLMDEVRALVTELKRVTSFEGTKVGVSKYVDEHVRWLDKHSSM